MGSATGWPARSSGRSSQRSTNGSSGARRSASTMRMMAITVLLSSVVCGPWVWVMIRRCVP
eukprot:14425961-Alexandrium_andersonii.AAC.1